MCRSIKTLRTGAVPASDDEIGAAALQYVRKVSGYRKPSTANERAFEDAVEAVAAASKQLLDAVAATLNGRPRKTLGWKTPTEALGDLLSSAQLTGVATTP